MVCMVCMVCTVWHSQDVFFFFVSVPSKESASLTFELLTWPVAKRLKLFGMTNI